MNSEEFVEAIKIAVRNSTVIGELNSLIKPAGRKPRPEIVEMSNWFNALPDSDKKFVERVIKYSADLSVFSFLAVLDGVAAIESGSDKGELELYYIKNGERVRLNQSTNPLHDIFNAE